MKIKDVNKWLKQAPKEAVEILMNGKKVKVIPQKDIETLLDQLTEQNWETKNFRSSTRLAPGPNNTVVTLMDASLELVVKYKEYSAAPGVNAALAKEITRTLVGAITFDIAYFGNTYHNNTAKSLCISNAASDLGRRFGKDLNPLPLIIGMNQPIQPHSKIFDTLQKISGDIMFTTSGDKVPLRMGDSYWYYDERNKLYSIQIRSQQDIDKGVINFSTKEAAETYGNMAGQ